MKVNEHIAIVGEMVVLVPYRKEHVQKYHEWMSDATIRELTASEPLTLAEEYDMQKIWQDDEDKLTFIIFARRPPSNADEGNAISSSYSSYTMDLPSQSDISSMPMIGDVNLFLKGEQSEEDFEAEVEIMIAEPSYRRQGLALHALRLFLSYVTSPLPCPSDPSLAECVSPLPLSPAHLVARIAATNTPSINLFKKLGFSITKSVEVFNEVEMRLPKDLAMTTNWTMSGDKVKGRVVGYL